MLNITTSADKPKLRLRLTARGHAGEATNGENLTCAAGSILAYTFAQIVKDRHAEGLTNKPTLELHEGNARIDVKCKDEKTFNSLYLAMKVVDVGYALLENSFPNKVKLTINDSLA